MARTRRSRTELEQILLSHLRSTPHCKEARGVAVRRLARRRNGANWTAEVIYPGRSLAANCQEAIRVIVPMVQQHFDLAHDA